MAKKRWRHGSVSGKLSQANTACEIIFDIEMPHHELTQERYFATFYGDNDNFDNWTPGIAGRNFEAYCLSVNGRRIKDPFYQDSLKYSETDLFDLIELLHRNIELNWLFCNTSRGAKGECYDLQCD